MLQLFIPQLFGQRSLSRINLWPNYLLRYLQLYCVIVIILNTSQIVYSSNSSTAPQCQCNSTIETSRCNCSDIQKLPSNTCLPGEYYSGDHCEKCNCNAQTSLNSSCNDLTGQCFCKENVTGLNCTSCFPNFEPKHSSSGEFLNCFKQCPTGFNRTVNNKCVKENSTKTWTRTPMTTNHGIYMPTDSMVAPSTYHISSTKSLASSPSIIIQSTSKSPSTQILSPTIESSLTLSSLAPPSSSVLSSQLPVLPSQSPSLPLSSRILPSSKVPVLPPSSAPSSSQTSSSSSSPQPHSSLLKSPSSSLPSSSPLLPTSPSPSLPPPSSLPSSSPPLPSSPSLPSLPSLPTSSSPSPSLPPPSSSSPPPSLSSPSPTTGKPVTTKTPPISTKNPTTDDAPTTGHKSSPKPDTDRPSSEKPTTKVHNTEVPKEGRGSDVVVIVLTCLGVLIILGIAIAVGCYCLRSKRKQSTPFWTVELSSMRNNEDVDLLDPVTDEPHKKANDVSDADAPVTEHARYYAYI